MTTEIKGLSNIEVKQSLELYGNNSLKKEKRKGVISKFFENLGDPIIRVLLLALGIQVIFTFKNINYIELFGIICAILLSTTVSTLSEYRSEKAFEKLSEEGLYGRVSVLRNDKILSISVADLVVGDIVYLSAGEKIQADGTIISGKISVDQSALNGEGVECIKRPRNETGWELTNESRVFRGTIITDGNAIMKVGRVGENTYYGMVAKEVQATPRESPLKLRLGKLAEQISRIGYIVAAIVGITFLFNSIVVDNGYNSHRILLFLSDFKNVFSVFLRALTLMITVVVVAAPEGLPMMITVVLSSNMKKMLKDNILIKKMVGIETAGSLNILFTDKTGTITVGKLQCDKIICNNSISKNISSLKKYPKIYEILTLSARYNTEVIKRGDEKIGGNSTDKAVYEFFEKEKCENLKVVSRKNFTSENKYSCVRLNNGIFLIKGAAELIIAKCKYALNEKGDIVPFDNRNVNKEYDLAVKKGERVIAVAYSDRADDNLTFVSLIVLKDKIRPDVIDAVKDVLKAGIQIVMLTGDSKDTAVSIAEDCGFFMSKYGHIALTSEELRSMSDEQIANILPKLRVISRALPQDKTRLVRISAEQNLVVGMTGDGINDAPSLKLADVGFAMGSGTDIAKSAADIVILDNSFKAISRTVLYGRTIFKSIRKFITFQLTMNLAACGVSLIGQFIGIDTPITIVQMLWVNIIMDTLGGLAFAGEAPLEYYMNEKPKKRDESILSKEMLHQIFFSGIFTLLICMVFLTSPKIRLMYGDLIPTNKFYTAFYALFIFAGIFNCLLARCERLYLFSNIDKNKPFIFIMLLISIIQICMIYYGGSIFRCVPLSIYELNFAILISFNVIPFEMFRRLIYKLK